MRPQLIAATAIAVLDTIPSRTATTRELARRLEQPDKLVEAGMRFALRRGWATLKADRWWGLTAQAEAELEQGKRQLAEAAS